jgi:hypothetical protein
VLAGLLATAGAAQAQGTLISSSPNPYFNGVGPGAGVYPGGWYPGWGAGISGGALQGAASVIDAQGNYKINRQQARLMATQVNSAQMDNKKKSIETWEWVQQHTPSLEEMRMREMQAQLDRARNNPPTGDIWSGASLNSLLTNMINLQNQGIRGPSVPLNQNMLRHINVTAGSPSGTPANFGLLKTVNDMIWPQILQGDAFKTDREKMQELLRTALQQANSGPVPATTITRLQSTFNNLNAMLRSMIAEVAPSDYITSMRYLNQVNAAINALQSPDVQNFATNKWSAQGATVSDLVQHMASNGLTFAPATQGDESFYTALQNAMASYDVRTAQLVSAGGSSGRR